MTYDIGFTRTQWQLVLAAITAACANINRDIGREKPPSTASKEALTICLSEYETIRKTISQIIGDEA